MEIFIPGIPPSVNSYNNHSVRNGKVIVANTKVAKDYKKKVQDIWEKKFKKSPKQKTQGTFSMKQH